MVSQRGGYDPANFLLWDDSALLALYSQIAAGAGLVLPVYLWFLREALGGAQATVLYGLRASALASAFLFLVHFFASNACDEEEQGESGAARRQQRRLPGERRPMAPVHAQHALSLLFTTEAMHAAQALALARSLGLNGGGGLFALQPAPAIAVMAAAYVALVALAWRWGALRCSWTRNAAAAALAARPTAHARGALARACQLLLAAAYTGVYAWRAAVYARGGRPVSHATALLVVFAAAWVHAAAAAAKQWRAARESKLK